MKKIFYIFLVLLSLLFANVKKASAKENIELYYVYQKLENNVYEVEMEISDFSNLYQTTIQINNNEELLIKSSDSFFYLKEESIYDNILDERTIDKIVSCVLIPKERSIHQAKIFTNLINFKVEISSIDALIQFLTEDIKLFLNTFSFDLIDYHFQIIERLNYQIKDNLAIEVLDKIPQMKDIIKVKNREETEYKMIIKDAIDNTTLGIKECSVQLIDLITNMQQFITFHYQVVDTLAPVITGIEKLEIIDTQFKSIEDLLFIEVVDNYSKNITLGIDYYDKEDNLLSVTHARDYLFKARFLKIKIRAQDESGNVSDEFRIEVTLIDTLPPTLKNNLIIINDVDAYFDEIVKKIEIEDNLDEEVEIFVRTEEEIIYPLSPGNYYYLVYAKDKSDNVMEEVTLEVSVKDTTPPTYLEIPLYNIEDKFLKELDLFKALDVKDNSMGKVNLRYFIEMRELSKEELITLLKTNEEVTAKILFIDTANNISSMVLTIKIIDTTPPILEILEDVKKPLPLNTILHFHIEDNYDKNPSIDIYIDDEIYNYTPLSEGIHKLKVEAKDKNQNQNVMELELFVQKESFLKRIIKNEKIIPILILMGSCLFLLLFSSIKMRKIKKKQHKKISLN